MTANPDSALRQALVALAPFAVIAVPKRHARILRVLILDMNGQLMSATDLKPAALRRAREAHALITEALQRGEKT